MFTEYSQFFWGDIGANENLSKTTRNGYMHLKNGCVYTKTNIYPQKRALVSVRFLCLFL